MRRGSGEPGGRPVLVNRQEPEVRWDTAGDGDVLPIRGPVGRHQVRVAQAGGARGVFEKQWLVDAAQARDPPLEEFDEPLPIAAEGDALAVGRPDHGSVQRRADGEARGGRHAARSVTQMLGTLTLGFDQRGGQPEPPSGDSRKSGGCRGHPPARPRPAGCRCDRTRSGPGRRVAPE